MGAFFHVRITGEAPTVGGWQGESSGNKWEKVA